MKYTRQKYIAGFVFALALLYSAWAGSIVVGRLNRSNTETKPPEVQEAKVTPYIKTSEKSTTNITVKSASQTSITANRKSTAKINTGKPDDYEDKYEITLTAKEMEALIYKAVEGKYSIDNISVVCLSGGGVNVSFNTGIIPGLQFVSRQKITVFGEMENNKNKSQPYYNINKIKIGILGVPEVFVSQAEEYLNTIFIKELEDRAEYSIETAYVSDNAINFTVRKK